MRRVYIGEASHIRIGLSFKDMTILSSIFNLRKWRSYAIHALSLLILFVLTSAQTDRGITIFMIGDSTMANKDTSGGKQERGWGMMLHEYFGPSVKIDNHAVNGRSSLSFINEGRWDKVLSLIQPGDYVIIQFGHNDEKPQADRHTDPGTTFDANLSRFVNETRSRGGIPILMNAVVRRNFVGDSLIDTHGAYLDSPRNVARELHTYFVDANSITHQLEQSLGAEGSKQLHMWFAPGQQPSLPNGSQDNTHYNISGARTVARLLADAICDEVPALRPFRATAKTPAPTNRKPTSYYDNPDTIRVATDGSGDFTTISEAIEVCRAFMDYHKVIYVARGTYKEKIILPQWLQNIEICGESAESTIITFDHHANIPLTDTNLPMGTFRTYTMKIEGNDITLKNLTIENNAPRLGQAVALHTQGDRLVFVNCRIKGNQDTIYTGMPYTRLYFLQCYICGTTDFIFGPSTAWFEQCTIESLSNSYVTAASTPADQPYGYVFNRCRLTAAQGIDRVYLGRPWRDYGYTLFMNCDLGSHIRPEGWHHWQPQREATARYYEYHNTGAGSATAQRVKWSHQLTAKEARRITPATVFHSTTDWTPSIGD